MCGWDVSISTRRSTGSETSGSSDMSAPLRSASILPSTRRRTSECPPNRVRVEEPDYAGSRPSAVSRSRSAFAGVERVPGDARVVGGAAGDDRGLVAVLEARLRLLAVITEQSAVPSSAAPTRTAL